MAIELTEWAVVRTELTKSSDKAVIGVNARKDVGLLLILTHSVETLCNSGVNKIVCVGITFNDGTTGLVYFGNTGTVVDEVAVFGKMEVTVYGMFIVDEDGIW